MRVEKILIPRAYARMESDVRMRTMEEAEKVECIELFIFEQVGTFASRKPTNIYLRLPKQNMIVPIKLLPYNSGLEFDKETRKYVLREYDELDRRIILGFCDNYMACLKGASHKNNESEHRTETYMMDADLKFVQNEALWYRVDQHAKRIKQGVVRPLPAHLHNFVKQNMKPYDEGAGIFSSVVFI